MSIVFFFKQKTAYEMRISDWSSDVCSSDLLGFRFFFRLVLLQVNQVLPVGDARFVLRQIQMQAIERDRIDLDLLIEQQWQQLDSNLDLLDLGERLLAKTSRLSATRVRQQPGRDERRARVCQSETISVDAGALKTKKN